MTYFGFLGIFVVTPIVLLSLLLWRDRAKGRLQPTRLRNYAPAWVIALHVVIAVVYTTPWDNYLVATEVWWYDDDLVVGIVLGWVPLEEYCFFVLQTVMTGMWMIWLSRRIALPPEGGHDNRPLRVVGATVAALICLVSIVVLVMQWKPGTYAALELGWAAIPIAIQLGFGADILWHHRRLVATTILSATAFLGAADALAISSGTWTISEELTLGFKLGGILPIEELLFFFLTNTLVTFGSVLALAHESKARLPAAFRPQTGGQPAA